MHSLSSADVVFFFGKCLWGKKSECLSFNLLRKTAITSIDCYWWVGQAETIIQFILTQFNMRVIALFFYFFFYDIILEIIEGKIKAKMWFLFYWLELYISSSLNVSLQGAFRPSKHQEVASYHPCLSACPADALFLVLTRSWFRQYSPLTPWAG